MKRELEITKLRDALKDLREAAAHVLANEPRDGIVGGPWLRSEYRDSARYITKPKAREFNICPSGCMIQQISGETLWTTSKGSEWIKVREVLSE